VRGLYKGAASPTAGCAFYSATLFLSYGQVCVLLLVLLFVTYFLLITHGPRAFTASLFYA
jgi:hypothetical protein